MAALPDDLIQRIRANVWGVESGYETGPIPTMLLPSEVWMLEWLARTIPMNGRVIVDAGSFLGGSTAALAAGLSKNESIFDKEGIIHSYDMFLAPNDHYSQTLIGSRPVGASVLDIFKKNLGENLPLVTVRSGDFNTARAPDDEISLFFLDLAKSWSLNRSAIVEFFPKMVPGETILIQQDHNDHSCPWVNVTMEYFRDHFDYLTDDGSSRIFLFKEGIPTDKLTSSLESLPDDEKIALALSAAERSYNQISEYLSRTSVAWLIAERSEGEAFDFLDAMRDMQPWLSERPYVDDVRAAIAQITHTSHGSYIRDYFGAPA